MMEGCGMFTSAHELLDRLRARQVEIGISNQNLDALCGFAAGQIDKYLGPSRSRSNPGIEAVICMMDALGLSADLHVDAQKVARMRERWDARRKAAVRAQPSRISREMVKRARPLVLNELRSKGGKARWADITAEQRSFAMLAVVAVRWNRRRKRIRAKHV
jgi:hypothetical protein